MHFNGTPLSIRGGGDFGVEHEGGEEDQKQRWQAPYALYKKKSVNYQFTETVILFI